ncbi:hypothetical protein [Candidatus Tisiphia endosymbiont of Ceraclea dissimilis]
MSITKTKTLLFAVKNIKFRAILLLKKIKISIYLTLKVIRVIEK